MKKTPRSIRVIATKITGGLHLAKKKPCQDFYQYACSGNKLVAVVSDGAGSAKYGKIGAKVVCETLVNVLINTPLKDEQLARLSPFYGDKQSGSIVSDDGRGYEFCPVG